MTYTEELVNDLNNIVNKISDEGNKRSKDLSNIDKELTDVYHYIEFSNFDVVRGYKAYKELQDVLKKRREIKNDLKLLSNLRANIPGLDKVNEACIISDIDVNNQNYTPRVREDLFNTTSTELNIEEIATSSGIAQVYMNKPMKAYSKHKRHNFNNLKEAMEFVISTSVPTSICQNTYKKIAKKIIKACLENSRYNGYSWIFTA